MITNGVIKTRKSKKAKNTMVERQKNVGKTLHRKQTKGKSLCKQDNQMVLN